MIKRISHIAAIVILITALSCVEEIPLETQTFESLLVIEATITNEIKQQEIKLSRSFKFGDTIPSQETGATVKIIDDVINTYAFSESEPGVYKSQSAFAAQPNRNYALSIVTTNGNEYTSSEMQLTQPTSIDSLYVERDFNENGIEGVSVYVDSFDPNSNSHYYRYDYEETYKVIAPFYSPLELDPISFELSLKEEQEQICYAKNNSKEIIITNTKAFTEDRVERFRVRFLKRSDYSISHRYSILVTQYVQSREAYSFYEALKKISSIESILSETQPGFILGNIISKSNSDEKVFGFFDVSSSHSKRVYFNYADLFPGEALPFISCPFIAPDIPALIYRLDNGFKYFDMNAGQIMDGGPFLLVSPICGDCTFLGENTLPSWWID